jgi:hypothetical protein
MDFPHRPLLSFLQTHSLCLRNRDRMRASPSPESPARQGDASALAWCRTFWRSSPARSTLGLAGSITGFCELTAFGRRTSSHGRIYGGPICPLRGALLASDIKFALRVVIWRAVQSWSDHSTGPAREANQRIYQRTTRTDCGVNGRAMHSLAQRTLHALSQAFRRCAATGSGRLHCAPFVRQSEQRRC